MTESASDTQTATDARAEIPPMAKRVPLEIEQVGRTRTDNYQWMKDDNWQQVMRDPSVLREDIREYLEAENAYTKASLEDPTEKLRETLLAEMRGRIKEDDSSVPSKDGPYAYYVRYREGGEYPIFARKPAEQAFDADAPETVLFDGDAEAEGQSYFSIRGLEQSPDHKLLASAIDTQGSEYYTIAVRNIETGEAVGAPIEGTYGSFEWGADSNLLYWVERDDNGRPTAVFQRDLTTGEDVEIYREEDPGFFVGVSKSESEEFIFVETGGHTSGEVWYFPADAKRPEPTLVAPRKEDEEYDVTHWNGAFYILTNADGAVDFKVMKAPIDNPGRENWEEVIPHRPGTLVLGLDPYKDHLVRLERANALPRIVVRARESGDEHTIAMDESAYDLGLGSGEYDSTVMRYDYASPARPSQVFDYDMETRERTLRKTREVPSGHNADDYVVERLMVPAWDGEEIPVTILRRADTAVDGSAPLLLYGYGSYGITIPASFSTSRLSLVDRGFVYAIAHVRGSQAKGYQWYLDGKLEKKPNTFKDYVSAGRYLVENGYGAEGRVVGHGGSAGGLLMGAAANMDPELFGGIIAAVPFVDVINTMSDDTLPLTPPEWPEWGNPITDAEAYDTILAYSPYDNVADKDYPAMLITGGLSDPRVTYWEPSKWAAQLRHEAPNAGPYYLRINMDAGHGGSTGRFEGLKETAIEYAFALASVGLVDGYDISRAETSAD
ncbi:S9 family peptidase [Henriciella marina]|uniref:S9 family peptidase n=1 Tax=Henriciella marina TaxID=453851 RepID=A0ABT4LUQ1_9PROT|nr:S9 family peptidase [Henriciella marina]MCZ4298104.1 S9 family peptidase [Henriciella marina]